ncbi:SMAD/FHA domain-containing protein [Tasmannia lanceolata]|uniref:SMAD/FHA domain-containing protein n=1 Tax=Tasmannia lanceolata TaxID=3420 RepID=UPI0040633E83
MRVPMGPPPPRNPNTSITNANPPSDTQFNAKIKPPPDQTTTHVAESADPKAPENPNPNPSPSTISTSGETLTIAESADTNEPKNPNPNPFSTSGEIPNVVESEDTEILENLIPNSISTSLETLKIEVPYSIPPWSEPPSHPFSLEVLKDGTIIDQFDVSQKGAYMFGRTDLCDFVLEHPTISRFHSVLQFKRNGDAFLYDLGSTHGTFVNKSQVTKKEYTKLHVGDVIRFGLSSRLYVFQGPAELMPPENDLKKLRNAKFGEEIKDREASLLRARVEASLADGISWGMTEDAIEEDTEEGDDEVTWQTFKGQLTEKQEKTREKIIKRTEKVANMKKEIDAIRAKDIAQGGLTQGQQTQIARNEQRILQILEELESLEETLNESIQESIGARGGKTAHGKKKGTAEDEDEVQSDDDDEFYDRTKKRSAIQNASKQQSIETADSLLDKKEAIIKEMEEKTNLISKEMTKMVPETEGGTQGGDALDAYMTGLSSELVLNATAQLQKELCALQSELDRILYLLKIADPMGEAAQRRDSKAQKSKCNQPVIFVADIAKRIPKEQGKSLTLVEPLNGSSPKDKTPHTIEASQPPQDDANVDEKIKSKVPAYIITKPTWLGAAQELEIKENHSQAEAPLDVHSELGNFVDYKDRKKTLTPADDAQATVTSMIEDVGPGLNIRKRKQVEKPTGSDDKAPELSTSSSAEAETTAADAVALLLKHERGYFASDGEERDENQQSRGGGQSRKESAKSKRVLGPERPTFLETSPDYESWVPPQGQSGDGRTSLNDRYGY